MNKIEIATAHNIVFRYELASVIQRLLASLVDGFLMFIYHLIVFSFLGGTIAYFVLGVPVFLFYHLIFEVFNHGQSPGKMLVKLRVVTLKGNTPSTQDYLLRWVFRLVDIGFSLGSLAILFITSSSRNQRLGDVLAQTTVVSLQADLSVNLKTLLGINKAEVEIEYPGITKYNDKDMLLVKQCIYRYQTHPNENNAQVLNELCERIQNDLNLENTITNKIDFLSKTLTDYILLTR